MEEVYTRHNAGNTEHLHRCTDCWRNFSFWDERTRQYIAPIDNGFVPASKPVTHAHDCPSKGQF